MQTNPPMFKHFSYTYQHELRFVFVRDTNSATALEPIDLEIGPMTDYAEILVG